MDVRFLGVLVRSSVVSFASLALTACGTDSLSKAVDSLTNDGSTSSSPAAGSNTGGTPPSSDSSPSGNNSSSGSGPTNASVNGTYHSFIADGTAEQSIFAASTFDGTTGTYSSAGYAQPSIGAAFPASSNWTDSGNYSVAANSTITLTSTTGSVTTGAIDAANSDDVAVATHTSAGNSNDVIMLVGVKTPATSVASNAYNNTTWTSVGINVQSASYTVDLTTIAIDSSGNLTLPSQQINSGTGPTTTSTPPGGGPASGSLSSLLQTDGTFNNGLYTHGAFSASGTVLIGADNSGYVHVAVKQGSGLSNANLNGTYNAVQYGFSPNSDLLTITLDGNGHYTQSGTSNSAGTFSPVSTQSGGSYTVSPNGTVTATSPSGVVWTGAVSADGNTFALVDLSADGNNNGGIIVGIHQ